MQLYELHPHVRYARIQLPPRTARKERSVCYDARLFYIEGTEGRVTVGTEHYAISHASAVYLPPLTEYRLDVRPTDEARIYTFNFDLVARFAHLTDSFGVATPQSFERGRAPVYEIPTPLAQPIVREGAALRRHLLPCVELFRAQPPLYRERASAYVKLCLLEMLAEEQDASPLCTAVRRLVAERYADPTLTNEALAAALGYHPQYINRVVKRELGMSLRAYIIDYRLTRARQLLACGDDSVSLVAAAVGFSSGAYFAKRFRERFGSTPREHRRTHAI